jgi:hypothetical protein
MTSPRDQALVIFARSPVAGRVKTRLMPVLTAEEARDLHLALLGDVAERSLRAVGDRTEISVAWSEGRTPPHSGSAPAESPGPAPQPGGAGARAAAPEPGGLDLLPRGLSFTSQPTGDLGERMALVIQDKIRSGFKRVVILGSDAPTLPDDHLGAAFDQLHRKEVVIGPAEDGGYYLVGMARFHPEIFMRIRWGTPEVLDVTRRRLARAGVAFAELGLWYDVDTPADAARLWKDLLKMRQRHPEEVPPRTWSVLSRLAPGRLGG